MPGPEGNSILPDVLAVPVTGVTCKMKMKCAAYFIDSVSYKEHRSTHAEGIDLGGGLSSE